MHADQQAFIRAICENPFDDAPRLVFADWLDENGWPARAKMVREQIAGGTELSGLEVGSVGRPRYRNGEDTLLALAAMISMPNYVQPWSDCYGFRGWCFPGADDRFHCASVVCRRGMIEEVAFEDWDTFLDNSKIVFASHPITKVTVYRAAPCMFFSYHNMPTRGWYSGQISVTTAGLPSAVWDLLRHKPFPYTITPAKGYKSQRSALSALSLACVKYGRQQAGLPPLPRRTASRPRKRVSSAS